MPCYAVDVGERTTSRVSGLRTNLRGYSFKMRFKIILKTIEFVGV